MYCLIYFVLEDLFLERGGWVRFSTALIHYIYLFKMGIWIGWLRSLLLCVYVFAFLFFFLLFFWVCVCSHMCSPIIYPSRGKTSYLFLYPAKQPVVNLHSKLYISYSRLHEPWRMRTPDCKYSGVQIPFESSYHQIPALSSDWRSMDYHPHNRLWGLALILIEQL